MNDKEIMENLLLNLKGECDLMMHGAVESSTAGVHSAFTEALNETVAMQNQVYSAMAQKGWYPATSVEPQKIDSLKQKYSGGC